MYAGGQIKCGARPSVKREQHNASRCATPRRCGTTSCSATIYAATFHLVSPTLSLPHSISGSVEQLACYCTWPLKVYRTVSAQNSWNIEPTCMAHLGLCCLFFENVTEGKLHHVVGKAANTNTPSSSYKRPEISTYISYTNLEVHTTQQQ